MRKIILLSLCTMHYTAINRKLFTVKIYKHLREYSFEHFVKNKKKYGRILDSFQPNPTPSILVRNNKTKSKTKTSDSLKVTKLIFAFYFFPLAWILSSCSEIYF